VWDVSYFSANDGPNHKGDYQVYLNDLIVFTIPWEEHLTHLREALKRLGEAALTLRLAYADLGVNVNPKLYNIVSTIQ